MGVPRGRWWWLDIATVRPRGMHPVVRVDRGVGTSSWPPVGTFTWPRAREIAVSKRGYADKMVSRLGFEPRTRGLKVSRGAVHGVVLGHSASVSRAALVHLLHQVGPSVTAVAGSVAGRSPASAAIASGRDPPMPCAVRPLPCSRVAHPDRPTIRGETVDRSADHADRGRSMRDPFRPSAPGSPASPAGISRRWVPPPSAVVVRLRPDRHRDIPPCPVRLALEAAQVDGRDREARVVKEALTASIDSPASRRNFAAECRKTWSPVGASPAARR